jgi:hypothetical protein
VARAARWSLRPIARCRGSMHWGRAAASTSTVAVLARLGSLPSALATPQRCSSVSAALDAELLSGRVLLVPARRRHRCQCRCRRQRQRALKLLEMGTVCRTWPSGTGRTHRQRTALPSVPLLPSALDTIGGLGPRVRHPLQVNVGCVSRTRRLPQHRRPASLPTRRTNHAATSLAGMGASRRRSRRRRATAGARCHASPAHQHQRPLHCRPRHPHRRPPHRCYEASPSWGRATACPT